MVALLAPFTLSLEGSIEGSIEGPGSSRFVTATAFIPIVDPDPVGTLSGRRHFVLFVAATLRRYSVPFVAATLRRHFVPPVYPEPRRELRMEPRRAGVFPSPFDFRISNFCLLQTRRPTAEKTIQEKGYEPEVADLSIRR